MRQDYPRVASKLNQCKAKTEKKKREYENMKKRKERVRGGKRSRGGIVNKH